MVDMSKAFTRESDDHPEQPPAPRLASPLPTGAKNYLTPAGARRLQEELERLTQLERPALAASATPESKDQLPGLDQRIAYLVHSLQTAVVAPAPLPPHDRVRFGATVTVRNRSGTESHYRLVGADETDLERGWVNWCSPIARALLNGRLGQWVRFKFPSGEEDLEIVKIGYEE
jgi:transcription elongation factor GreB